MSEATVDSIKINATASTAQAEKGLERLIVKVEKLSKVINASFGFNETSKLDDFVRSFEKLKHIGEIKISKQLADSVVNLGYAADCLKGVDFSKVEELANAYKKLADVGNIKAPRITGVGKDNGITAETETVVSKYDEMIQKNSEIQAMYDRVDASGSKYSATIRKLTTQLESGKISEAAWVEELKKMNAELDAVEPKVERVTDSNKEFAKTVSGAALGIEKLARSTGKLGLNIALLPFRRVGKSISDTTKRLGNFFASIKRVALYRAIRTALKEISQGFKEGMENLYQYSKAINGEFAASMDLLATDALYAKNSLGAMAAPIINSLAPAIDLLTDKFVGLLNVVNETIASLTGADTWTKAVKYPVEYAEAADDANKAAKKWKATILGFDELNPLNDNSSSSGGAVSDALDYSKMFTEETVKTETAQWVEAVIDAWNNADFTSIGASIGEGIKTGLDNIPWSDINAKGSQFSQSLGTLINGFVEVEGLGRSFGSTIANAINFGVGTLHTFIKTVHWDPVGKFLGDGITGFFNEMNTKELGQTISDTIIGAIQLVHTFFKNTDFELIGKRIGELLEEIDWVEMLSGLAQLLFDAIKAALDALKGLIEKNFFLGLAVGGAIALKITAALKGTSVTGLITSTLSSVLAGGVTDAAAGEGVAAAATTAGNTIGKIIGGAMGVAAASYFGYKLGNWLYNNNVLGLGDAADGLMNRVADTNLGDMLGMTTEVTPTEAKALWSMQQEKMKDELRYWEQELINNGLIDASEAVWTKAEIKFTVNGKKATPKSAIDALKNIKKTWDGITDKFVTLDTKVKGEEEVEETAKVWKSLADKHIRTAVSVNGQSLVESLANSMNKVTDKSVTAIAETVGVPKIDVMQAALDRLNDKTVTATAETQNTSFFDTFREKLAELADKTVTATADTKNTSFLDTFKEKLVALADKTVTATAVTKDVSLFDTFKSKLSALADKTVKATANVFGASDVDTLAKKVDALTSKSIDITANVTTVTSTKSDTTSGKAVGTNPNMQYVYLMASGGMPDTGDLFIARENGAELVGQIGNRTSVANNEQIISGISAGVETANAEQNQILREQNELLRQLIAKEGKTVISTASLVSAFGKMNKREGQAMVSLG